MARKFGKKNEMKVDLASYNYFIQAIAGWGKTTLVYEVGDKLYGDEGTFILTVGREPAPNHIDGAFGDKAVDWSEVEEIIEELCENKADYQNTKIVAIDSVDEVFRLAENEVIAQFNKTVPADKKAKSIKQCFGGYGAGENRVVDLVIETIFKLNDYGYSVFPIGHTKFKNKVDPMTDVEYEQLTSTLENKYYNAIKDKVNIVGTGYVERELFDLETVKDAFSKKDKQVGKVASERRVLSFRDEEFAVDVKSHFITIPAKIEFSTDNFIEAILTAIKDDLALRRGEKVSDKEIKAMAKKETKEKEEKVEVATKKSVAKKEVSNEDMVNQIKEASTSNKLDAPSMFAIMKEYKVSDFGNPDALPTEMLEKIVALIQQ